MSYLLDTSVLSASSKKRPPAHLLHWMAQHEEESFVSVVSLAELKFGLDTSLNPEFRATLEEWLAELRQHFAHAILGINEPVLVEWKQLLADLKGRQRTISCEDSLIAATALQHRLRIVTTNPRDFEPCGVETVALRY